VDQPCVQSVSWMEDHNIRAGYVHIIDNNEVKCYTYSIPWVMQTDKDLYNTLLGEYVAGNLTHHSDIGPLSSEELEAIAAV
jgi:hypothetical protein